MGLKYSIKLMKHCSYVLWLGLLLLGGCTFYRFTAATIPTDVKTIYIDQFRWAAEYADIDFLPKFRDEFMNMTNNRTKLVTLKDENGADWVLEGSLVEYRTELSAATSGDISAGQVPVATQLTLNVTIRAKLKDKVKKEEHEYTVSEKYVADGAKTLPEIQSSARDELISRMSQKLFNQMYVNW